MTTTTTELAFDRRGCAQVIEAADLSLAEGDCQGARQLMGIASRRMTEEIEAQGPHARACRRARAELADAYLYAAAEWNRPDKAREFLQAALDALQAAR